MAFTKIQPQQVQLATFLSPSGDLTFTDNVTGEYKGKKVFTRPRVGKYYINKNENKTYIN